MDNEITLTTEEAAHIRARRELAGEAEKKRIKENEPFDINDITPGMARETAQRARDAIAKAWGLR